MQVSECLIRTQRAALSYACAGLLLAACSHADELDDLADKRTSVVPPALTPCLELLTAVSAPRVGPTSDADPRTPRVDVAVSYRVSAECKTTTLEAGLCTRQPSGRATTPSNGWPQLALAVAPSSTGTINVSLPDVAGQHLPCLKLDQVYELPVERVCESPERLCSHDSSCRTDTATNHAACGDDCRVCPSGDQGTPICVEGRCALTCNEGYRYEAGACRPRPSCKGQASACDGKDCCALDRIAADDGSAIVFRRGYDQGGPADNLPELQSATSNAVSVDPFYLDRYEVTVGRFRAFVAAYERWLAAANPRPTHGGHPRIPTSRWQATWPARQTLPGGSTELEVVAGTRDALVASVTRPACGASATWTHAAGANEGLPINCVSYFVAYMFCIWDGEGLYSRLPTEAEWNAAAAGGPQQRAYPWSTPANDLAFSGRVSTEAGARAPLAVGQYPDGAGYWGTLDLAGNVAEWVRDAAKLPATFPHVYEGSPSDPIDLRDDFYAPTPRVVRGGSFLDSPCPACGGSARQRSAARATREPGDVGADLGFRCARSYP